MQFRAKELWRRINFCSLNDFDRAVKEWSKVDADYRKNLQSILPLLKPSARALFKKIGFLHDGTLLSFEAGDALDFSFTRTGRPRNTQVRISVQASDLSVLTINYQTANRIEFNFPSDKPLFDHNNIGDWGYDQLTLVKSRMFRHKIVFSSGATILIESQQITVKKQVAKRKE